MRVLVVNLYKKQLNRIERKLDELLSRLPIQTAPPPLERWEQTSPNPEYQKAPWWMNPAIKPPTLTCNVEGTTND